ncbi:chromosome partitioning protein ParA [Clostridia bacterium]|nr:chromosome partitioning protein ParA [Clostridia bacterium]
MSKIIAFANQKGGVAKTTTAWAMAAGLANRGYKVLAVDLDPQGNLSQSFNADAFELPTVYNLLRGECSIDNAVQHLVGLDVISANVILASAESELSQTGKEHKLKEALIPVRGHYDYILLDAPPSLGVLTANALTAADEVVVPTTASIFATMGINELYNTVTRIQRYCNASLVIRGILLTKYNPRANVNADMKELIERLGAAIKAPVFSTFIRNSVIVEQAQANSVDLFAFKGNSPVAEDYAAFIEEYLKGGNVNG